ncbi:MAG: lysophospholipid acyltransferase family protein [Acidobacteria bacterium]|nr:lysophospholipid acyltransferase family protein [Acidobacteriota bacterium]MCU0253514.1 lysophospholipid acyltransferase family protein [Acidobacteriota bacterium]
MKSRERSPLRRLEAWAALPLIGLSRALPPRSRVAFGYRLGRLAARLDARHTRLAARQAEVALGLSPADAERLARACFAHFGRVLVEVLALPRYARPAADRLFATEGLSHLSAALARGRGAFVFSAHFGNWELVALRQALAGHPMDFVARPLDNPWLDADFNRWRETAGNRVLGKHGALRAVVRSLREGRAVAILVDQDIRGTPQVFVPFFGRLAAATSTMGELAVRTGAAVVPVVSFPRPDGGYRIVYQPELEIPEGGDAASRAHDVMARATAAIEGWVRQDPAAWLWLHNRWKSRPPGETPGR